MNPDLDTLATRMYVTIDDLLIDHPERAPERPAVGIAPKLSDAELLTLSVLQALLGFTSEARFIRHAHAHAHLHPWFPFLPERPGDNKRLRRSGELFAHVIAHLARACPSWNDDLWLVDSTPVEFGRSRETVKRSDLAGWATYGYCASRSRFFWGRSPSTPTCIAGLLVHRPGPDRTLQVLLAQPGGPLWARRDLGAWSIPKGEHSDEEDALAAARREFVEIDRAEWFTVAEARRRILNAQNCAVPTTTPPRTLPRPGFTDSVIVSVM